MGVGNGMKIGVGNGMENGGGNGMKMGMSPGPTGTEKGEKLEILCTGM